MGEVVTNAPVTEQAANYAGPSVQQDVPVPVHPIAGLYHVGPAQVVDGARHPVHH